MILLNKIVALVIEELNLKIPLNSDRFQAVLVSEFTCEKCDLTVIWL